MDLFYDRLETPIGFLTIEANNTHILKVLFDCNSTDLRPNALTQKCKEQLEAYFAGTRVDFDLPVKPEGTAFQQKAWQALLCIGYGQTASYGQQAHTMDNPKAVRAVGAANGQNKLTIIVPCHRVIGANGSLTGYTGGIERKKWLLAHEQRVVSVISL